MSTSGCTPSDAKSAAPPKSGGRVDTNLDHGWSFLREDVSGAQAFGFDDSAWTALDLPHTWNATDGQDGPTTPYYRGVGWYRKHYSVPNELRGQRLYLQFDGSFGRTSPGPTARTSSKRGPLAVRARSRTA